MSAIATLRRDNGIIIACDSASSNDQGTVISVTANKLIAIPELDCAIGNVGVGNFTPRLRAQIGQQYASFDDLLLGAIDDFRTTLVSMMLAGQTAFQEPKCTAIYAGWSKKRERFETYRISASDKTMIFEGVEQTSPALTLVPVPGDWCSSAFHAEDRERFGLDIENQPVVNQAIGYVCACRAASTLEGSGDFDGVPYVVGGHIQVMQIERNMITTWIPHGWPDKVGERLDPTAGEATPSWLLAAT